MPRRVLQLQGAVPAYCLSMRLKKLTLHGFKTFADRTEIVFAPGVSAIVGPNGFRQIEPAGFAFVGAGRAENVRAPCRESE